MTAMPVAWQLVLVPVAAVMYTRNLAGPYLLRAIDADAYSGLSPV